MNANLGAHIREGLESHEFGGFALCQGRGIEGKRHVHVPFCGLGAKLSLGLDFLAIYQELVCNGGSVLVNGLLHERAAHAIGFARGEVLVVDGIGDAGLGLRHDVFVFVDGVGGRGGDARRRDGDGLALVLDVCVDRNLDVVVREGLEGHELRLVAHAQRGGVKLKGQLDLAGLSLGEKLCLGRDGLAVYQEFFCGDVSTFVSDLLHEGAKDAVRLADVDVAVAHGVGYAGLGLGHDVLVAVGGVCGRGLKGRRRHANSLVLIGDICVGCQLDPVAAQGLKDHELGLAALCQRRGVEGEDDLRLAV